VIQVFKEEKILENVAARSQQLFSFLQGLKDSGSKAGNMIEQIRGRGLMVGLQFKSLALQGDSSNTAATKANAQPQIAPRVAQECLKRDMLLLSTSVFDVLRFIPPLTITEDELNQACKVFQEAFEAVAADS
jgi:4-aminobutyrate aminotransferase